MAVRKTKAGLALKRWFKEDWKDVRTGKACGRKKGENGVLHIVVPRKGFRLRPQKPQEKCPNQKKPKE